MKMLFVSSTVPTPTWGGAIAFYRHFVEQKGFEVSVITDSTLFSPSAVSYPLTVIQPPTWLERLKRTRLGVYAHGFEHQYLGRHVPRSVLRTAREFEPELIMTVAGSWSWLAEMSRQLAGILNVPLIGSFNDWYSYNLIIPAMARRPLERTFRGFYRDCDLALCTCEGMRDELGSHPNAIIHYPSGAFMDGPPYQPRKDGPIRILFGGNLGDWYGPMLERLITLTAATGHLHHDLEFVICGSHPSWSSAFDAFARESNIYIGHIPFSQLKDEAARSDVLLLLMGFGADIAQFERTSFKTKFLDYLSFQRPIAVWGPDYSSAVRIAREFGSGDICISNRAEDCLKGLLHLARNPGYRVKLVAQAGAMYQERFHPDKIHQKLLSACHELVRR